jgi:CheY-like chemotaxis protein
MRLATILIIEDHSSVRMLLTQVLADAGYLVYETSNGRQGLEQFRAYPVDLVLTDLEMPKMKGLDVILELTRMGLDVKIIAMSGMNSGELQKAKLYGVRQVFPKPLDLPALLQAIHDELRERSLDQAS